MSRAPIPLGGRTGRRAGRVENVKLQFEMTDRDYAHYLLGEDIDLDAQLLAIRDLLSRHRSADEATSRDIEELAEATRKANGPYADHLVDLSVDRMRNSVYQDAAHSMAAAGMLAPLMESILVRLFAGVGRRPWPLVDTVRRDRAGEGHKEFWNAQINFSSKEGEKPDIVLGVRQLAAATGLAAHLPDDFDAAFEALVLYRNRMFHNGFEWPVEARAKFKTLIATRGWSAWFQSSLTNHEPWIFYMSPAFVDRCLTLVDQTLDAAGRLVRERTEAFGFDEFDAAPVQLD
jgi:hypothetical protein